MKPKASSLPTLITAGIFLILLIGIAIFTSLLAKQAQEKLAQQKVIKNSTISPTPTQHSVYLDLPESFPKDFPLIPSFIVTSSSEDDKQWGASFFTPLNLEELTRFYDKELVSNAWQITNRSQGGGITIIYASKNRRSAILAIGKGDNGMAVSVTILK